MCSSFAAKEALVKALGTGFRGIYPPDISVIKNNLGKPDLFLIIQQILMFIYQ